jgi:hypothetical protein
MQTSAGDVNLKIPKLRRRTSLVGLQHQTVQRWVRFMCPRQGDIGFAFQL